MQDTQKIPVVPRDPEPELDQDSNPHIYETVLMVCMYVSMIVVLIALSYFIYTLAVYVLKSFALSIVMLLFMTVG